MMYIYDNRFLENSSKKIQEHYKTVNEISKIF